MRAREAVRRALRGRITRHESVHQKRHGGQGQHQNHKLGRHLPGEDPVRECRGGLRFALGVKRGIARQERRIDGAFPEDGAKIIGKQEREQERIRQQAVAQDRGHQDVAHKSGDARQKRETAHREKPPEHQGPFFAPRLRRSASSRPAGYAPR